ncbi:MAG: methionyl-tRNA formyltransferase [Chloroflexota bacterium]
MTSPAADSTAAPSPARAVFFGSGRFALAILDVVRSAPEVDLVAVVSTPDRPAGRRAAPTATPVAAQARELGLRLLQPPSLRDPAAVQALADLAPAVGVLADYGKIVPRAILEAFPRGILNVHPSLLPAHRGASPIPAAIIGGDREFGVTLIELVDRLDAGPIVARRSWPAQGAETSPELEQVAATAGAALLRASIGPWLAGAVQAQPQDEAAATLTRPFRREDGRLLGTEPVARLERRVRALMGWPGTFVEVDGLRIVVLQARPVPDGQASGASAPGTLVALGDGLALAGADGLLELVQVQPAGGRPMSGAELRRGRPRLVGAADGP